VPAPVARADSGLVLWAGTVRTASLAERIAAAATAGYSAISLSPHGYRLARSSGMSGTDIRSSVADAGLQVSCFDPFTKWLSRWEPPADFPAAALSFLDADESDFLRAAEAVGAVTMTVFEPFGVHWPEDVLAAGLASISDRAAGCGIRVNAQFIPFLGIADLAAAWRLVQLSGAGSAGIVLDTWHYFRGVPDDGLLAAIPGNRIGAVQVSDAAREPCGDLETDCLHHRLPAGTVSFPWTGSFACSRPAVACTRSALRSSPRPLTSDRRWLMHSTRCRAWSTGRLQRHVKQHDLTKGRVHDYHFAV